MQPREIRNFLKKWVFFQQLPQHARLRHQTRPRGLRKRGRYWIRTSTHQWLIRHLSSYLYNIHYLSSYSCKIYYIPTTSTLKWVVFVPTSHKFYQIRILWWLIVQKERQKDLFFPLFYQIFIIIWLVLHTTILPNFL